MKTFYRSRIFTILVFLIISVLITYPAFSGSNFSLSYDGSIYLSRIEQLYSSLKHLSLPPFISFIGMDHNLGAMSSMYPWMTSLIFVVPMFFINNKLICFAVGFVIVNFITAVNFYVLSRVITKKTIYQYLGVILYVFNGYHIQELFVRNAMGESLAYAFLPLVIAGCIKVWNNDDKAGIVFLSIGMIGIANSHILSLYMVIICLIVLEAVRLLLGRFARWELRGLLYSALWTILGSSFMIYQFIHIVINNRDMVTASKHFEFVSPLISLSEMVNNHMRILYDSWNIGIVCFCLLLFLILKSINTTKTCEWNLISWCSLFTLIFSYGYIYIPRKVVIKFLYTFQFAGRIYVITVILISIAVVIYFSRSKVNNLNTMIITILTILIGVSSIIGYKQHPIVIDEAEKTHVLNNQSYDDIYSNDSICSDYTIKGEAKGLKPKKFNWKNSSYDSAQYIVTVNKKGADYKLPVSYFKGIDYKVLVNGKKANYERSNGHFQVKLFKRNNLVTISSQVNILTYVMFVISVLVISIMTIMIIVI